jgi:polyisoprenoid-binding protein YceI
MSWTIDSAHTRVAFSARHMMISNVHGQFENVTGTVEFDEQNPTATLVDVQIDAKSINTRESQRDAHLISPDFLDAENFPYLTFKSTQVEKVDDTNARLYGDLTIRGVTRPVIMDVEYHGLAKSPWGTTSAGFSSRTKINRKEWGLEWNVALETGGWLVGEMVNISIELEIVKQAELEAQAA